VIRLKYRLWPKAMAGACRPRDLPLSSLVERVLCWGKKRKDGMGGCVFYDQAVIGKDDDHAPISQFASPHSPQTRDLALLYTCGAVWFGI
jgi:hypothetical protein